MTWEHGVAHGGSRRVVRYRVPLLVRLAVAGAWFAVAGVGVWIRAQDTDGSVGELTSLALASFVPTVLLVAVSWWAMRLPGVTLTDDALIWRGLVREQEVAWRDISSVVVGGKQRVLVTTPEGTWALPLASRTTHPETGTSLVQAVTEAWFRHRGVEWFPLPLAPWAPARDLRGDAVLRPPLQQYGDLVLYVLCFVAGRGLMPVGGQWLPAMIGSLIGVGLMYLCSSGSPSPWSAVRVRSDVVIIRTWRGRVVIPRSEIVDVEMVRSGVGAFWSWHVRLVTTQGWVQVRAVCTGETWGSCDPLFYRKLSWLHAELAQRPMWSATGDAGDAGDAAT